MRTETIGKSTLYLCDCMKLMATMPDKSIDLAIVDPPYGINYETRIIENKDYKQWDATIPDKKYFDELFRVSKNQIICGTNYYIEYLKNTRCFIVWNKLGVSETMTFSMCELLWTSFNTPAKVFTCQSPGAKGFFTRECERIHPCQKPISLYKWVLYNYAKPGDKILDTHFGSGSIAIACNELGYNLIASEIDADYFDAACKRVKEANSQLQLFREAM